jgi:hypothetical protein
MTKSPPEDKPIDFATAFIESGIQFQQYCVSFVNEHVSHWKITNEEYPVLAGETETHVDFVMTHGIHNVVVECKHCNPRYKAWLFPKLRKYKIEDTDGYGVLSSGPDKSYITRRNVDLYSGLKSYRSLYGLAAKVPRGDKKPFDLESIQNAAYQVAQSTWGLMKERVELNDKNGSEYVYYYPVIFTTAKLYYLEHNPLEGDISNASFKEIPWVIYYYGVSASLWNYARTSFIPNKYFKGADSEEGKENPHKRLPVIIVNDQKMGEFFAKVNNNLGLG